jgi:hypothetical protein
MDKLLSFEGLELIVTFVAAILASSGFWIFMEKRTDSKDLSRRLLIGLAHDRIVYLCLLYIERRCVTQDEYENLIEYLYKPYREMGGNGTAERLVAEVNKLTIVRTQSYSLERKPEDEVK